MTEPTPTPQEQNLPASPDSKEAGNSSTPERDGFFERVRQGKPHPSEKDEIVIDLPPIDQTDSHEQT
jgi:hypothetical protein